MKKLSIIILSILILMPLSAQAARRVKSGTASVSSTVSSPLSISTTHNFPKVGAIITVEQMGIRWYIGGTPSVTAGHIAYPGDPIVLNSDYDVNNFHCIIADYSTETATIYYTIYSLQIDETLTVPWRATGLEYSIFTLDNNSGISMQPTDSGVSLLGVVSLQALRAQGYYTIQLGTVTFGRESPISGLGSVIENLDPGGTGDTADAGISIYILSLGSNTYLTNAQWEAVDSSLWTSVSSFVIGSADTPFPIAFTPSARRYQAIACYSSTSQFLVPEAEFLIQ